VLDAWNAGSITTAQADALVAEYGLNPTSGSPAWFKGAPAAEPGITIEGGTLSQQVTGKTAQQLEEAWPTQYSGKWKSSDNSLPYYQTYGTTGPTQYVTVGNIRYKARMVITSPNHGIDKWGGKGKWNGGDEAQRKEVLWLQFKASVDAAANPKAGYNYSTGGWDDGLPRAIFVNGEATRLNPAIKQIMDQFGGKKKTLKVGDIGTGYEVPTAQIKALDEFLKADATFTPTGAFTPMAAAPPPPPAVAMPEPTVATPTSSRESSAATTRSRPAALAR